MNPPKIVHPAPSQPASSGDRSYLISTAIQGGSDSYLFRSELQDSQVYKTCIHRSGWDYGGILYDGPQKACLYFPDFRSHTDEPMSRWGEYGCISCRAAPRSNESVLCKACYDDELSRAPAIIQVPEDHKNYKSGVSTATG